MCLAIPAKITEISGDRAIVDFGGVTREVMLTLVENVKEGDYVLVHTGYCIAVLEPEEARESLRLWKEILSQTD